ncbi:MAG: sigma-70 family RNA polymerase sigma factor [Phycisphaerae bacterium]|nr:MAG: sigma-70 family RNA polymerase sigma factor [Planctomycetota bacterium]KAB2950010.1 MAG: sigma-70 family RNA polymerase sigma factor [Phycisphaerae bacterium]MBE7458343.1 sigma-70 family RNA polymerase sigma factor [Planctomycetia bacterium]MCK6465773.1 sigma-70 family RNA polymerase sigma factor [Phycisphaerae bacterium]MCL4719284.1 sigma-70 family RNA polymerase sigma factor [Phycisphaerae bacterium]
MDWITTSTILHDLRDATNEAAWRRLTDRFRRPIIAFALRMGLSAADAEDAAQETLTAFVESFRRGAYDPARGRLSRWLFGIAYHQALRERRRRAQQPPCQPETSFWNKLPDEREASWCWDAEWEQALLEECLARARLEFEPETFRAFECAMRADGGADDVARQLGIPVKTVYNAKHRVLKRVRELRAELEEVV